jgi:hypothetical protein
MKKLSVVDFASCVAKLILPDRYNSALAGGSLRQAVNYKQLGDINLDISQAVLYFLLFAKTRPLTQAAIEHRIICASPNYKQLGSSKVNRQLLACLQELVNLQTTSAV